MAKGKQKTAAKVYPDTDAGKSDKFKDFAQSRTVRALKSIRAVARLSSPRSYKFSEDQVKKITLALRSEIELLESAFAGKKSGDSFTL